MAEIKIKAKFELPTRSIINLAQSSRLFLSHLRCKRRKALKFYLLLTLHWAATILEVYINGIVLVDTLTKTLHPTGEYPRY